MKGKSAEVDRVLNKISEITGVNVQAFRNGLGPFLYHLTDPDFLQAVSNVMNVSLAVPLDEVLST